MKKRIIIIGCGRSGTMFTAQLLRSSDLKFGHEKILEHGGVGWTLALPEYKKQWKNNDIILHQIRHPWQCISSLTTHCQKLFKTVETITGKLSGNKYFQAADYWIKYNCYCMELAQWSFRIEDIRPDTTVTKQLFDYCGIQPEIVKWPETNCNTRNHVLLKPVHFSIRPDLINQIQELSYVFGY